MDVQQVQISQISIKEKKQSSPLTVKQGLQKLVLLGLPWQASG